MPTLRELMEKRTSLRSQLKSINDSPAGEGGTLSESQTKQFSELRADFEKTEAAIDRQALLDEADRRAHATPLSETSEGREQGDIEARFSVAKAVREQLNGGLTGIEREFHDEQTRNGREARGLMMPTSCFFGTREERALLTSGSSGNMIQTDLAAMTDRRRPSLKIESMGATVLSGLSGDLDLPRLSSSGSAKWVDEHEDATRSDVGFEKKSMGPKTVSAEYELSRRMKSQSHQAIEPILRSDIGFILAQAVDSAAIRGGGVKEPTGIMSDPAVAQLPAASIDSDVTADLMTALEVDDVTGSRAFLTHPAVMGQARKLKDSDGLPIPTSTTFHSERVDHTTQAPKISTGPDTYPLIYGEWASLYLGYWSGVDILLNPYHGDVASKGGVLMHAFLDCDILVRHPEAFRWVEVA